MILTLSPSRMWWLRRAARCASMARIRARRAAAKQCADCGGKAEAFRCGECGAEKKERGVYGEERKEAACLT